MFSCCRCSPTGKLPLVFQGPAQTAHPPQTGHPSRHRGSLHPSAAPQLQCVARRCSINLISAALSTESLFDRAFPPGGKHPGKDQVGLDFGVPEQNCKSVAVTCHPGCTFHKCLMLCLLNEHRIHSHPKKKSEHSSSVFSSILAISQF